jgi:L-alanine-DL-glutamate epimerase-like enolase superfamily enzyme
MKIVSVESIPLQAPIDREYKRARQVAKINSRKAILAKIVTDKGFVGYGEGMTPVTPLPAKAIIDEILTPFLLGKDPLDSSVLWETLYSINSSRGYIRGYQMIAIAAIDMALWDLKGKILNQPVYKLLGGAHRSSLEVYATGIMTDSSPEEAVELAHGYKEQGVNNLKFRVGVDDRRYIAVLEAMKKEFDDEVGIMVDANGGYDPIDAIRMGKIYEKFGVYFFEEPVICEDLEGLLEVRRSLNMHVAAGESEYNKYSFRDMFSKRAVTIVQPDVSRAGGITECMKIVNMAQVHNIKYAPHSFGSIVNIMASAHLSLAAENFTLFELDFFPNPLREDLSSTKLQLENGYLKIPDTPGLGVEPLDKAISRYRID